MGWRASERASEGQAGGWVVLAIVAEKGAFSPLFLYYHVGWLPIHLSVCRRLRQWKERTHARTHVNRIRERKKILFSRNFSPIEEESQRVPFSGEKEGEILGKRERWKGSAHI